MDVVILDVDYLCIFPGAGCVLEDRLQADVPLKPSNGVLGVVGWILMLDVEGKVLSEKEIITGWGSKVSEEVVGVRVFCKI